MFPLPGVNLLGHIYNLDEGYASAEAIVLNRQLFDLPQTPVRRVVVASKEYTCPQVIGVNDQIAGLGLGHNETYTTQNLASQFKIDLHVNAGVSGLFSGELRTRYEQKSTSNLHFYHVTRRGWAHSYEIALPHLSELKRYLKHQVSSDINSSRLAPRDLIERYGTHFLNAAIFGGEWSFTRSVSCYQHSSDTLAAAQVEADFLDLIGAGIDTECREFESRTASETRAVWLAKGGRLSTLPDFRRWAESMEEGEFALVGFDHETSLQPISVLADDLARQTAIQTEIERQIARGVGPLKALYWCDKQVHAPGDGGVDLEVMLTDPHQVIVGFGGTVHGGKGRVTHLAAKWLDLRTNETGWIWAPRPVYALSGFNRSDYEMIYPTSSEDERVKGMVLTGLKLRAEGGSLHEMELCYRKLDPADLDGNGDYVSERECDADFVYRHSTDQPKHATVLGMWRQSGWDRAVDLEGKRVMIGIGLSYHSDGRLPRLRVTSARLALKNVA